MQKHSIEALARQQLKEAAKANSGRAADTVFGGHERVLRQTVVAMREGAEIGERDNLDESTIYVLSGRLRMRSGENAWLVRAGGLLVVPQDRHSLTAVEDTTLLITVAKIR